MPAFGGAFFIAVHYLLVRAAAGRIDDRLGAFVLEATAAAGIGASLLLVPRLGTVVTARIGIVAAVASGLAISVASVLLLRRFGGAAPLHRPVRSFSAVASR
jgi:hypothetical protein